MEPIDRVRVLVVDGDPAAPSALRARLRATGWDVHRATDTATALAIARGLRPAAIVFDAAAVDGDPLEFCRAAHADPEVRPAWTLLLAPDGDALDCVRWLDAGADDVLRRPFATDELLARLRVGVRARTLARELSQSRHERALLALAVTLGHEVNNPLTALVGHLELAGTCVDSGDAARVRHHIQRARATVDRIADVAHRMAALREARTTTYLDDVPMLDLAGAGSRT